MSQKTCSAVTLLDVGGLIKDLLERLAGANGNMWLKIFSLCLRLQPKMILKSLELAENKFCFESCVGGNRVTFFYLLERLVKMNVSISAGAKELMVNYPYSRPTREKFVRGCLEDLFGFDICRQDLSSEDILLAYDLRFCLPDDIFYLTESTPLSSGSHWYVLGMKPIEGKVLCCSVRRSGELGKDREVFIDSIPLETINHTDSRAYVWIFRRNESR